MAMIAPAPTQTPSTAAIDRLAAVEHRLDEVAGHPGEGEQALHVAADQRADDVVDVAAGAEVAAVRAEDDDVDVVGVGERAEPVAELGVAVEGQRVLALRPVERDARDAVLDRQRKCLGALMPSILRSAQPVADRLQAGDQLVRLGGAHRAEQLVDPGLVRGREPGELRLAARRSAAPASPGGRPRPARRATSPSATSRSTMPVTLPFETLSTRRQLAHLQALRRPGERGQHVEARQGRVELPRSRSRSSPSTIRDTARRRSQRRSRALEAAGSLRSSIGHASPPEIEIAWPVTEAAPSPQSQSTAAATSSGSMNRPCGLAARSARLGLGARPPGLGHDGFDRALEHRRAGVAGADRVDGDAGLRGLERQRPGQADHAVLGGAVARDIGVALEPGGRGDGDQPPPSGVEHRLQRRLPGREDAR